MIPFGKYDICYTDTFKTYAIVTLNSNSGFIGIDKDENELFQVYPYDNGPDYVSDGLFRIIRDFKIGFADVVSGRIIIQPVFDFSFGFESGLAIVNIGGHKEKVNPANPNGEYHMWRGGKWGVIDKTGRLLLDIKYDYLWNHILQQYELVCEDEKYRIVNDNIIKTNK